MSTNVKEMTCAGNIQRIVVLSEALAERNSWKILNVDMQ